ncbi:hypothetical protein L6164_024320 [Bauhinia variegata]|uniref:Uncharacterized protein n=1 Tax=Bauhinia variegata TaxID=167791 RepID=A0ACB9LX79_BAUVA|nr:hypothetical protein L6164_024320 [Bauhinia variegata]
MPRPGPRPYECVRRAWHSDRHQPIRGTLIREIFRVVDEIHGSTTKKNREYQEKLPVVVLRAEEIMYSKANSEAEYMDLTTLLERTNDAIDTIIRRDESMETGQYLHPCIEAALCLGCSPRKSSRSQRNSPRCYLNPTIRELPRDSHNEAEGVQSLQSTKSHVSHCPNFVKTTSLNYARQDRWLVTQNDDPTTNVLPFASENVASTSKRQRLENNPSANMFSVYPLYYGNHFQFDDSQNRYSSAPAIMGVVQNHAASNLNVSNQSLQPFKRGNPENPRAIGCDLSLRLGSVSIPAPSQNYQLLEDEERSKFSGPNYTSCTGDGAFGTSDSFSNKQQMFEVECFGVRKRKAGFLSPVKNQQFCLQP